MKKLEVIRYIVAEVAVGIIGEQAVDVFYVHPAGNGDLRRSLIAVAGMAN